MKNMKKIIALFGAALFIPQLAFAAQLTDSQISAILGLLRAFEVEESIVLQVQAELSPEPVLGVVEPVYVPPPIETVIEVVEPVIEPEPIVEPTQLEEESAIIEPIMSDTTAPLVDLFSIDETDGVYYLRVFSNEPLDFSATTGVTIDEIIHDGRQDSTFKRTNNLGYYYEGRVDVDPGVYEVTVKDTAGNGITRTVEVI